MIPTSPLQIKTLVKDYCIDAAQIKIGRELGRGAYGVVYEGEYHGYPVALKLLT